MSETVGPQVRQGLWASLKISILVHVVALVYQLATTEVFFRETPLLFVWDMLWGLVTFTVFMFVILAIVRHVANRIALVSSTLNRGDSSE